MFGVPAARRLGSTRCLWIESCIVSPAVEADGVGGNGRTSCARTVGANAGQELDHFLRQFLIRGLGGCREEGGDRVVNVDAVECDGAVRGKRFARNIDLLFRWSHAARLPAGTICFAALGS